MESVTGVQILDEVVYVSFCAQDLWEKSSHSRLLVVVRQNGFQRTLSKWKKTECKPFSPAKNWPCVNPPPRRRGWVNTYLIEQACIYLINRTNQKCTQIWRQRLRWLVFVIECLLFDFNYYYHQHYDNLILSGEKLIYIYIYIYIYNVCVCVCMWPSRYWGQSVVKVGVWNSVPQGTRQTINNIGVYWFFARS